MESDQHKAIAFSTEDEGVDYVLKARKLVIEESKEFNIDTNQDEYLELHETYVVWFAYILSGWKALVSTSRLDGRYYEVTHNQKKGETYVDTYVKIANTAYSAND